MADYIVNLNQLEPLDYGTFVYFKSSHILKKTDLFKRSITQGYDLGYVVPNSLPMAVKRNMMQELNDLTKYHRFNTANNPLNKWYDAKADEYDLNDFISLFESPLLLDKKNYPNLPEEKSMLTIFLADSDCMFYAGQLSDLIEESYDNLDSDDDEFLYMVDD